MVPLPTLRAALAAAICDAQELPTPRDRLQQMRYSLLCSALNALDPESGCDPAFASRIAVHALIEWRSSRGESSAALPGVALV